MLMLWSREIVFCRWDYICGFYIVMENECLGKIMDCCIKIVENILEHVIIVLINEE